jgi:hypothetical protein
VSDPRNGVPVGRVVHRIAHDLDGAAFSYLQFDAGILELDVDLGRVLDGGRRMLELQAAQWLQEERRDRDGELILVLAVIQKVKP